jgi:HEPN domain-containing protein
VQQAAEKLVKALLVLAGEPFRRTHDLDDLAARLVPVYPQFSRQAETVRHLSIWGIELERMIDMLKEFATMAGSLIDEEEPAPGDNEAGA